MALKIRHFTATVLASTMLLTADIAVPQIANAQTLLDQVFDRGQRRQVQRQRARQRQIQLRRQRRALFSRQRRLRQQQAAPVAQPARAKPRNTAPRRASPGKQRIRGPQFYSYKALPMVPVNFSKIDPKVKVAALTTTDNDASDVKPVADERFVASLAEIRQLQLRARKDIGAALIDHYNSYPEFLWTKDGKPTAQAKKLQSYFAKVDQIGLRPEDYALEVPITPENAVEYEMALSLKVLRYISDARNGRIDPNKISGYHDLPRKKIDMPALLASVAQAPDVADKLDKLNPQEPHFDKLKRALAELRNSKEQKFVIPAGTFIRPGQDNPALATVLEALWAKGDVDFISEHGATLLKNRGRTQYVAELVPVIKGWQRANGLGADGVIGPKTVGATSDVSNAAKVAKIELAMERMRWLPDEFGNRHVFINQPAFTAAYFENGAAKVAMPVVVGKKSNQTNFFHDEIERVEFNPYWGVPQSIIVNEMLPKLRANPGYLDNLGYETLSPSGRKISSRNVDWYNYSAKAPVGVRQPPGPKNALGELKIMFPNKHNIYMHDTPQKKLFSRPVRAYSHGCVRLEQPRVMASAVLGMSQDQIANQIAGGKHKTVQLDSKIPVYVSYFTAWPNADGKVEFYNDIYSRDQRLLKAMDTVKKTRGV